MSANQRLGPYELQQRFNSSALIEVWKAFDVHQRRYVTLYIHHVPAQVSADTVAQFESRMQVVGELHHPNIAQVLDIRLLQATNTGEQGILVVTEYIEGSTLGDYIRTTTASGQAATPDEIVRMLTPLCAAIDYAHQQGIVHGAIKPDHLLLDKNNAPADMPGVPKLVAFCTRYLYPPLALELSDACYTAPEQAQGYIDNPQSDIYALGILLYEICTGTLPFQGDTAAEILMQQMHTNPTSPALINPHLLPALTAIILRCLAKDPRARFGSATAIVTALARALNIAPQNMISQSTPWQEVSQNELLSSPTYLSPKPYMTPQQPALTSNPAMPAVPLAASQTTPTEAQAVSQSPQQTNMTGQQVRTALTPAPVSQTPPAQFPAPPPKKPKVRGLFVLLAALLVIVLLATTGGWYLLNNAKGQGNKGTPPDIVGHAFFANSGQYTPNSNQGIADIIQIHLDALPDPQPNKSYYFWLLSDNNSSDFLPILLGSSANSGQVNIPYGNAQNNDLLANYSKFLVTEEDSAVTPNNPSLDKSTWRYSAAFSQIQNPQTHLSLLNHLRHLLAQDPKLKAAGLTGGLDIWLYRNALNVMVLASSLRDAQRGNPQFLRRQIVRILDYLDGSQYIKNEALPPGIDPVLIDPTVARVALLEFDIQNQEPPGYLKHIGNHLAEITQSPGVTPEQKVLATQINNDLNNVQGWLSLVHKDAQQLLKMSDQQLLSPDAQPVFNDLYIQANQAFTGRFDPNTNQAQGGISQVHAAILRLATFDIEPYHA